MEQDKIIKMYNEGYSIKYIIDMYYKDYKKGRIKLISCPNGRKIIITDNVTKEEIRKEVYHIIYNNLLSV